MLRELGTSLRMLAVLTLLTGAIYPAAITAVAQVIFPGKANGSLIRRGDAVVGSELIGQPFEAATHFWSRPSATSPFAYNSGSSSGSNLGPTNPDLAKALGERATALRAAHPEKQNVPIPVDLLTASASGLDPHISPAAAEYQIERVAKARKLAAEQVRKLVAEATESRTFGILGEPRVNVLKLNLSLDAL